MQCHLPWHKAQDWLLTLDRTHWQFGQLQINILFWIQRSGRVNESPAARCEGLRTTLAFFLLEAKIDDLLTALSSLTKQRSKA